MLEEVGFDACLAQSAMCRFASNNPMLDAMPTGGMHDWPDRVSRRLVGSADQQSWS